MKILFLTVVCLVICSFIAGCNSNKLPSEYENLKIPEDQLRSKKAILLGKSLFSVHCASCHGENGDGMGPRQSLLEDTPDFTNHAWIEKNSPQRIYYTIMEGKQHSVMVGWRNYLKPDDVWNITAFILSLSGKTQ